MDSIIIEKASDKDLEFIKKLEIECGLSAWKTKDYQQEITNGNALFLVARKDGRLAGFILARLIMFYTDPLAGLENKSESEIEIYNIAVNKEFRRERIASKLLDNLYKIGKKNYVNRIYLEVRDSNLSAQKFYLQHSFKITGNRRNFYTNPSESATLMCHSLIEEKKHLT